MIEIYLSPENDVSWTDGNQPAAAPSRGGSRDGSVGGAGAGVGAGGGTAEEEAQEAAVTARELLKQLRPEDVDESRYQVLSAYARMAGRQRGDVEAAVGSLLDVASSDPNNVPVLLALAHGFVLMKQVDRAWSPRRATS
ncbi:flagellar associated protein [Monoraphidium neglectum]|uniref:Flagellar associated protein n=1 Tax=Monoraphidium neglectum TaxID=145388 RepID=A0A0D2LHA3_9CHLO|nr:flagellar associated protein [Monoraphidium neglectum]KIY91409.1 flagellar associated protein [Monoraphidium neglectum]|eukprot:XP_013890429.1 flagellar associated protein [Monoraphidium neglectum]